MILSIGWCKRCNLGDDLMDCILFFRVTFVLTFIYVVFSPLYFRLFECVMNWVQTGFRYDFMRENGVADADAIKALSEFMLLLPAASQAFISDTV